jgi:hypothetical protein
MKISSNKKDRKMQMIKTPGRRRSSPANHQSLDFEDSVIGNCLSDMKFNRLVHFAPKTSARQKRGFGFMVRLSSPLRILFCVTHGGMTPIIEPQAGGAIN